MESDRTGFTDVLSIGMLMMCTRASMRPTVRPVKPTGIDFRLVLAITRTKIAVKTISVMTTAASAKPAGEWSPYPFDAP